MTQQTNKCLVLSNAQASLHGGAAAAIFDGIFGVLFSVSGGAGYTANLSVDYRKPAPLAAGPLLVHAKISGREGRKIFLEGKIRESAEPDSPVSAESTSLFLISKVKEAG